MQKNRKGFTLLELLTVIIIVGILGALALPNYMKAQRRSYAAEAWANTSAVLDALKAYYMEHNSTWTTDMALLPMDDPNSKPGRKFNYTIDSSAANEYNIWADGTGITGSGSMIYRLRCTNCMQTTESITRADCPNGTASCQQLGS